MNLVWLITALYAGPLGLWAYFKIGRLSTHEKMQEANQHGEAPASKKKPFWQSVAVGAMHCGSGCALGDLAAEGFIFFVPLTLFGRTMFAAWAIGFLLAFLFGIAFQYFTIKPRKRLSAKDGLVAALKADSLLLTAWEVGMYGWMALAVFVIFGHEVRVIAFKRAAL